MRGSFGGYKTEIVPCYQIKSASQKLSAVDRTPLHTQYIKEHLQETQKKDVRLFKQFLRGIGCYGAEAEIEGFSGYLCELLILKYTTFQNLLTHAQYWKIGEYLALTQGKFSAFDTPLVFIDPVDIERNVSSALSKDKFTLFIHACKAYIRHPRITFFFPNKIQPWPLKKIQETIKNKEFIGIKISKPECIPENLYPQIRKALRSIRELCERYDFSINTTSYHVTSRAIYLIFNPKKHTLSPTVTHMGPPVQKKDNAKEFREKWSTNHRTRKKPYVHENRWYVQVTREYTDLSRLLNDKIRHLSLGKNIDQMVQKHFTLLEKNDLLTNTLRIYWTSALDKKMSWER